MNPFRFLFLLLVVVCCSATDAWAQASMIKTNDRNGATIEITMPFSSMPSYGFIPLQIKLENPGGSTAKWSISHSGYGSSNFNNSIALECPPQETRTVTVMMPVGEVVGSMYGYYGGSSLLVIGEGVRENKGVPNNFDSSGIKFLVGSRSKLNTHVGGASNFDTTMAPADWRAYQGFQGVGLSEDEWRGLAPGARLALLTWVKSGGALAVVSKDKTSTRASIGLPAAVPGADPNACGLGRLKHLNLEQLASSDLENLGQHGDAFRQRNGSSTGSMQEWRNRAPALFGAANTPLLTGLMLLVVTVFAVVIGPVNLFLIAPAKRRHRLFFSVPIISAAAGALLMLGVIVGDGFGGKGTRHVLVENQPGDGGNNNHVIQYQTSRCGVLFSTGFTSKGSVFVERLAAPESGRSSRGQSSGSYGLEVNDTEVVASGPWFSSRSAQHFRMAAVVPTRGRIEASGDGAATKLTSSFDFPIASLLFSRDGKNWFQADGLRQGEPTGVKAVHESIVLKAIADHVKEAPREITDRLTTLKERPMHYIAFTEAPPAIDSHSAIKWTDHGIITGPLVIP